MRPGKRRALEKSSPLGAIAEQIEASIRAKVEHPFRVIKRQFGFTKVRISAHRGRRFRLIVDGISA
jgi:IS5 family transposase